MFYIRVTTFQSPSLRGSGRFPWATSCSGSSPRCFNPLHCGAVVASHPAARRGGKERKVSIPFIAGQWSLLRPRDTLWSVIALFQSPSLRGSGRFAPTAPCRRPRWSSFNPLHCGAVVASRGGGASGSPPATRVSIPFIAGQWSLPGCGSSGASRALMCFNPLHCGAVVASNNEQSTGCA